MTDENAIHHALSAVEAAGRDQSLLRRNGRLFMALPARRLAALHTLWLYQPQRRKARWFTSLMQFLVLAGLHRMVLPRFRHVAVKVCLDPAFDGCMPGTAGVMLGSPEHRVRRAILSYQTANGREVAKVAFGVEGRAVIQGEAEAIRGLPEDTPGVPDIYGVHHGMDFSMLRMPYVKGLPLVPRRTPEALALLDSWITDAPARSIRDFPEWPAIHATLARSAPRQSALADLENLQLQPVIRHGDFARWNLLRQNDNSLIALDWEWGHPTGMPGLDLVHYFLQDARLVARMEPSEAIRLVCSLLELPLSCNHLDKTGWPRKAMLPIIASLAWKQGAGHQENAEMLEAAVLEFIR
jgi:hypothetical protein